MPTYVYKFVDTGETIEVQQAFTDDALTEAVHPTSGVTMKVKKVFLPVGVSFKGGGFYKTDSRGSSSSTSSTASGSSGSSTSSSTAGAGGESSSAGGESSTPSGNSSSTSSSSSTATPSAAS
jgi:predicted nucleic acid-binding Zn ribbon protein